MREGQLGDTGRVVVTDDERQKENIDQRPFPRDGADGDGPCGRPHAAGSQASDFRFFFHSQNSDHQRLRLPSFLGCV